MESWNENLTGFQSQSRLPLLHCRGKHNIHFLTSASGAAPANLVDGIGPHILLPAEVRLLELKTMTLVLAGERFTD